MFEGFSAVLSRLIPSTFQSASLTSCQKKTDELPEDSTHHRVLPNIPVREQVYFPNYARCLGKYRAQVAGQP